MKNLFKFFSTFAADLVRRMDYGEGLRFKGVYSFEHIRDGKVIDTWNAPNAVVNVGLDDALDKWLKGSGYTAAFSLGLTDGTPTPAPGDTMGTGNHTGWAEVTDYSESIREVLTLGTVASQSVDNSASKGSFSINGTATVGGAFLCTNSTKGGETGTLISVAAFTGGDRAVISGDTLNVTYTITSADA